jgi:hypothetical protein
MSRSTILVLAVLGIVAVSARYLFLNAPRTEPRHDQQPASVVAREMPEARANDGRRGNASPPPLAAPEPGSDQIAATTMTPEKARQIAAKLRQKARFPPTSRRIEDNVDPIIETRGVKERLSPPGQGRTPTLVVYPSATSYEAPNPILLYAKFIREYPGDWTPRTDAEIAGELWNAADVVVAQVELRDDGQGRDIEARDGLFTAELTPAAEHLDQWNGLIRVQIFGETGDADRRSARTRFYYGTPAAKLTGYYRDQLVDGHLQIQAEVEVKGPGEYRLEASIGGSQGLIAWSESTAHLDPGIGYIPLTFWGLAFRQADEPGPYRLASIQL